MQYVTYFLVLIVIILLNITGFVGSITPAIPGPPLCLIAMTIAYFFFPGSITTMALIIMLLLCLIAATIDYFAPMLVTKLGGGSKYAMAGSTIGIIVGLFFPPWGIIWIPFVGAFIGELIANFKIGKALKIAFLSFISFMLTTGFKLILCSIIAYISLKACF